MGTALQKRNKLNLSSFDTMKGLAILLVILLHTLTSDLFAVNASPQLSAYRSFLYFFGIGMMPMFLILTGWGFKDKAPRKMLKKTFSGYIVPYLWVMAAYAVICPLAYFPYYQTLKGGLILGARFVGAFLVGFPCYDRSFYGIYLEWITAAWFLLASFVGVNLLNLILKLKKRPAQAACVLACFAAGALLFRLNFFLFCIPHGLMAVGYCYVGYLFRQYGLFEKLQNKVWIYLVLIPIYLMECLWGHFDLCIGAFNNVLLDYIGAGCAGLLLAFAGIHLGKIRNKLTDAIAQIGSYSLWILCIHAAEMEALPWPVLSSILPLPQDPVLRYIVVILPKLALILLVCSALKKFRVYRFRRQMAKAGR